MTINDLRNVREAAELLFPTPKIRWQVCIGVGGQKRIKAAWLTESRARDWAQYYDGGYAEKM